MDGDTAFDSGNKLITTTETVENQTTEFFDYIDYDILEVQHETIFLNDIIWVKIKEELWEGGVINTPFSDIK